MIFMRITAEVVKMDGQAGDGDTLNEDQAAETEGDRSPHREEEETDDVPPMKKTALDQMFGDFLPAISPGEQSFSSVSSNHLTARVQNQGEKMEIPGGVLFRNLESLEENEFKDFKWYLQGKVLGFPGISKSRLEKADREDTVDLMLLYYCINTIKVTREVLKMIPRNDLEEELSKTSSDPEDSYWADGMAEVEERVSGGRPGGKAEAEAGKLRGPETGAGNKAAMGPVRSQLDCCFYF
ncbi:uncharacterized protein LOC117491160 [Trematomus bernacchii]|uniref:uncharacterized protein LOC117491160 n=1 Tax=Trematomus bernacchii TaxID=40690 RepID=UPI00146F57CA|nr:uncharacterized protein LOC117491160 [Trematomus bernacchii]